MDTGISLVVGDASALPSLEALWVGVHRVHAAVMPELAPYVTDEQTWAARLALYEQLLAKPDTVLLLARESETTVGYGLAHVMPAEDTWLDDTWIVGRRIGEIESLAVAASHRGEGIGSTLLTELESALRGHGVDDIILGVLPRNEAAIRLYAKHGYIPTWLYLSKLSNRA